MNSYALKEKAAKQKIEKKGEGRLSEWNESIEIKTSKLNGEGLFAKEDIKKGTVLWEEDNTKTNHIPLGQFWSFPPSVRNELYKYCWQVDDFMLVGPKVNEEGKIIDSGKLEGRYIINHSSNPNAWFVGDENLVARRDIKAGEEITIDYVTIECNGLLETFQSNGENETRKSMETFDFEKHLKEYEGHILSYVYKISKFCEDQAKLLAGKGSGTCELHKNIECKPHPLGFGRGLFAVDVIPKGTILWMEILHNYSYSSWHTIEEVDKMETKQKEWVLHFGYQTDINIMNAPNDQNAVETDLSYCMNHNCDPTVLVYNRQNLDCK